MFGFLSVDIICSENQAVFRERSSLDNASYIFSRQMEATYCVYFPSNIFRKTRGFENLRTSKGYSLVFAEEYSIM